jgi:hypothetical protein
VRGDDDGDAGQLVGRRERPRPQPRKQDGERGVRDMRPDERGERDPEENLDGDQLATSSSSSR